MPGTHSQHYAVEQLVHKLQALAPERIREVADYIDFLSHRDSDRQLTEAAMAASEPTLQRIWDNADDAEYDRL